MEKLKYALIFVFFCLVAVLTYSLVKSFFYFDKGIEVGEEEVLELEKNVTLTSKDNLEEDSKVIWKNFLYYPTEPSVEEGGFGPSGYLNHAKNLTFVNLTTGKVKKLFDKKVYIWDYFPGEFIKKNKLYSESLESQKEKDSLEIPQKFLIFAVTKDTNGDGFLNNKDKMKFFIYDPALETLLDILPSDYYVEKLLYNTKKDFLVLIVKNLPNQTEPHPSSKIFTFDVNTQKSQIIEIEKPQDEKKDSIKR